MRRGPHRLGRRRFFPPRAVQQAKQQSEDVPEEPEIPHYDPSLKEVLVLKEQLQQKSNLPIELIEAIIDLAEYWPHTVTTLNGRRRVLAGDPAEESAFMLRSQPLGYIQTPASQPAHNTSYYGMVPWKLNIETPTNCIGKVAEQWKATSFARGENPCRKIVFIFESHDQGRCGNMSLRGSYKESWTWFDVGKEELLAFKDPSSLLNTDKIEKDEDYKDIISTIKERELAYFESQVRNGAEEETIFCVPQTISPLLNSALDQPVYGTKFMHRLLPEQNNCIQRNKTAILETHRHVVTWKYDDNITDPDSIEGKELEARGRGRETGNGDFVRGMKIGDAVTVWAKARFGGWHNEVEGVEVKVFWAV